MSTLLTAPQPNTAPTWQDVMGVVGMLRGDTNWGRRISHTSFDSDTEYAHTLRNLGTGGHLKIEKSTDGTSLLTVTDSGLTLTTLNVSGNASVGGNLQVSGDATVNGNTALGNASGDVTTITGSATISTSLSVGTNLQVSGDATVSGNTALGNAGSDTTTITGSASVSNGLTVSAGGIIVTAGGLTVTAGGIAVSADGAVIVGDTVMAGDLTVRSGTVSETALFAESATGAQYVRVGTAASPLVYADIPNIRVLVGSGTALSSAGNDRFSVVGGRAYIAAPNEEVALGLRYNTTVTGTYYLGATNSNTPDLVARNTSGALRATVLHGGGLIVGTSTSMSGSELLRVNGAARVEGALTVTTGGVDVTGSSTFSASVTVSSGGIGVTGSSSFTGGVTIVNTGLTISAGGAAITGDTTISTFLAIGGGSVASGGLRLANNVGIFSEETGGTDRQILILDSSDVLRVGVTGLGAAILNGTITALQSGGTTRVRADGTGIAFFGATAVAKQTVTGSRGGNAALQSLCSALANYGLITDSTS